MRRLVEINDRTRMLLIATMAMQTLMEKESANNLEKKTQETADAIADRAVIFAQSLDKKLRAQS